MKIRLEDAKNASSTCVVDGRFLHSKYNPENEAKNFVNALKCDYIPSCLIITCPALGYCIEFLQQRFINIPIYSIQYHDFFLSDEICVGNQFCKKIFLCSSHTAVEDLSEQLFSYISEIDLSAPLCISWPAGGEIFVTEDVIAWDAIKLALTKTRDVIATRSFFSLRWMKNVIKFCISIQKICIPKNIDCPIALVASGPTLKYSIEYLKENQSNYFIISLSSALEALLSNGIIPNMCISTDGGYYATKHLDVLYSYYKKGIEIPLAVCSESNVPTKILENCPIVPLCYVDSPELLFFKKCSIPSIVAIRNGTVSGTAADLSLSITDKEVYAFGLDLQEINSHSHIQPNAHETIKSPFDFKLNSLETRVVRENTRNLGLTSFDIYRQWFETRDSAFAKRFFRVKAKEVPYNRSLGKIQNIDIDSAKKGTSVNITWQSLTLIPSNERKSIISDSINKLKKHTPSNWIVNIAPAEYIAARKYPESKHFENKLSDKISKSFSQLEGLYS